MKNLSKVLPALVLLSMSTVGASTNKTFLMPRPQGVNLPIEQTTFMELIHRKSGKKFGGNLAITGFYQHSEDKDNVAKYFLVNGKSTISLTASPTDGANSTLVSSTVDIDPTYFIHQCDLTQASADIENTNHYTLSLAPEQTVWAAQIDYKQDLHAILRGLFAYAHMPIAYVQNKINLKVGSTPSPVLAIPLGDSTAQIEGFFNGTYSNLTDPTTNNNLTYPLGYAKMGGTRTAIGIADIDLGLGYSFFDCERHKASIAIALTIPTGNKPKGEYVFEPICGNGDHFALGADLGGFRRLVGNFEHNLKINVMGKYRYLFEHNEQRTLGIKGRNFGQYFLLGGTSTDVDQPLYPAADLLTLPVNVTPGSQFDGIAGFTYNYRGFTADLGYNVYYRESEKVNLRSAFQANLTEDNQTWYIAARGFDTTTAFGSPANAGSVDGANLATAVINDSTIDTKVAATPEQLTNGIYASLGYVSKGCENPWMLGIGGKYDWASRNSALEQWNLWLKTGIGF